MLTDTLADSIFTHRTSLFQILHSVGFQFKNTGEWTEATDIVVCRTLFLQSMKVSNTGNLPAYLKRRGIIRIAVYRYYQNSEENCGLYIPIGNFGWNANVLHVRPANDSH